MALTLALLEGLSLFVVGCSMILFWANTVLETWTDVAILTLKGFALAFCSVVAFYYSDLYDFRIVRNFGNFVSRLLQSFGVTFILLAGFYTVFPKANIAGGPFVSSFLIVALLLLPLRAVSYAIMRSRPFVEGVLILGWSSLSEKLIQEIDAHPHFGYVIGGVVDEGTPVPEGQCPYPRLGSLQDLDTVIREVRPSRIFVALGERRGRLPIRDLLDARMQGILVEEGVQVYERLAGKLAIEALTPSNLIFSTDFKKSRLDLAVGRAVSLLASISGLVLLAPLFALIAAAIKLDSRGPVLFVQDRVGLNGQRFSLIKFRTMHPADRNTSEWAQDNSHRITRLGRWLRTFRLDELPQFWNILRGDMNLVGPRPHPVSNFELFVEKIPYYALRSVLRPGVTGWAQVRYGYANNLQEETEKMRYDLYYVKHLSFRFDLRILFDTVKIVLFGRGTSAAEPRRADVLGSAGPDNGHARPRASDVRVSQPDPVPTGAGGRHRAK